MRGIHPHPGRKLNSAQAELALRLYFGKLPQRRIRPTQQELAVMFGVRRRVIFQMTQGITYVDAWKKVNGN